MVYNMSIFEKVDFLSLGACAIMKKDLEPSFLTWEYGAYFVEGLDTLGKLRAKY